MTARHAAGDPIRVAVTGRGVVEGAVESVAEVRPMGGLPGMVWRLVVRLPDGARAEAMVLGGEAPAFADPRYRAADPP
ncbi:MAG TPA: hypothetical protein VL422_04205 [Miltoncostaea sp.]|nr:hypothetical protein [Miltoncostaea sp.]